MTVRTYPMTYEQEAIWLDEMVRGGASPYLESWVLELRGDVDRDAVRRAFATLVARHDALRSRFVLAGEEPAQIVEPAAGDPEIPSPACSPGTVDRALRDFVSRPMDLSAGAWRAALFEPEAETVLLAVQVHHVVVDDWALHTLEREFVELYRAAVEGRRPDLGPVLLQPGPFARQQRAAARDDAAWAYWQQALGSLPDTVATAVPGDAAPDAGRAPLGRRVAFPEEPGSGRRLRALCRTLRATPFAVLTATAAAQLHRATGAPELVVGVPVSGRGDGASDGMVAPLLKVLPLRLRVDAGQPFAELVRQVRTRTLEAVRHRAIVPADLARLSRRRGTPGSLRLARTLVVVDEATDQRHALPGATARRRYVESGTSKADLCYTFLIGDEVRGMLDCAAGRYSGAAGRDLVDSFRELLASFAEDGQRPVSPR
ncbi:condensation domain-containing protein [Streptomyces seoulensis]